MSSQPLVTSSKKDEKGKNIQVVVRCRPFNQQERKANSHSVLECDPQKREVSVRTGAINDKLGKKNYTFDMVFAPSAKQIEVYRSVVCPILDEVIMGYNCTVFAYGQTGTGKTFTMEGERSAQGEFTWEQDPLAGIIPRTLHQIFEKLSENGTEFSVKVSLLEIYNEELFDLLSPSPDVGERLQMFDDPRNKRGVIIKGLEEITVHNKDEVYHILERGAAKRTTASTLMNAYSSRSHSVFSITIHMKETTVDGEELVKIGKLNLVDLAGSENIGRSGAVDKRAREAGNINQSLLTLGRVITALVERAPHIPYRESKLTRILQDSLGGRTKTSIIATVSPASINLEETLSTLDYASRAKNILNKPEVNQKLTKRALIKEYTEEIERLKRDLAAAREKNGVYLSSENYEELQGKIVCQDVLISEYTEKIAALEDELKRVIELFSDSKKELEECSTVLQVREKELEETQKNLHESKLHLAQEEFVVSALQTSEKKLHSTANKLLDTVQETTKDVSGLHAKLDRKKVVEQHNAQVHENFAEQMDKMFTEVQRTVDTYNAKQQGMLDSYIGSIDTHLAAVSQALNATTSAVSTSFTSVSQIVSGHVGQTTEEIMKQEGLSAQARDELQKLMTTHAAHWQNALTTVLLPSVTSVLDLNAHLSRSLQSFFTVAEKVESHKEEMDRFFTDHSAMLNKLRLDTTTSLSSMEAESRELTGELKAAEGRHSENVSNIISCLQNQLNLLAMETSHTFQGLAGKEEKLQRSGISLRENLENVTTEAITQTSAHHKTLVDRCGDVAGEIRERARSNISTVEESSRQYEMLSSNIAALSQDTQKWYEVTTSKMASVTEQQEAYFQLAKTQQQSLHQDVGSFCDSSVEQCTGMVNQQRAMEEAALSSLARQVNDDKQVLVEQKLELHEHTQAGINKVHTYLKEELRSDVPTGTTPQRKDYVYPLVLTKTKPRDFLLEQFKKQQEEVLAAMTSVMSIAEEPVEQDSLDDEPFIINDSIMSEKSIIDVNVLCQENGGVPFFQQKKGKKDKENKANVTILEPSKLSEDAETAMPRSKIPLRSLN
ncbi:LOW QUALITY PROTEIN: kinesin-like protein KIF11 [Hyperolius riggenbachi]|uniref:LOW QUALITY PROTEIN: kinesin-like protein KIF11 n=1 Tax=Hyperolius riggenbachi TaxID=752182 RepID=UPI0035A39B82